MMVNQGTLIGVVRLARDRRRLLILPLLAMLVGMAGVVSSTQVVGALAIALIVAGLLVAGVGIFLAAWLFSYRLEVEAGALRVRWLGGQRRYRLVRGQLTRVVIRGPGAAPLRPRLGVLGLGLGPALLRGEEHVELVRLSSPESMILVPTDRGRLAIAAYVEQELLDALVASVRRQQELDAAAHAAPVAPAPMLSAQVAAAPAVADSQPARILTGIERALLEERLAAERAAAQAAAEAERGGAAAAGATVSSRAAKAGPASISPAATARTARQRARTQWHRPGWVALPAWMTRSPRLREALPVAAPLLIAGVAWIAAATQGRVTGSDPEVRYLIMALALTGPVAALAVVVARTWQPRLAWLVSWSALAAQALLARALIG